MNRRDFFIKTSFTFLGSVLPLTIFQNCKDELQNHSHSHNHHNPSQLWNENPLTLAISKCIYISKLCTDHCLDELAKGDNSLIDCAKSSREVTSLCSSFLDLYSQNSNYAKEVAKICVRACNHCAEECKKHADKHTICKECMDACLECAKELKLFA